MCEKISKTDESKRRQACFGRKVLTDENQLDFVLGPFLI
jgi:hypothetical protein